MIITNSSNSNVDWKSLFSVLKVKPENRKMYRSALRKGIASFEESEKQLLLQNKFINKWFNENKAAIELNCATETVDLFNQLTSTKDAKK